MKCDVLIGKEDNCVKGNFNVVYYELVNSFYHIEYFHVINKRYTSNWSLHCWFRTDFRQGCHGQRLQRLVLSYTGFHNDTHEPVAVKAIDMSRVANEVTQYLLEGEKKAMMTIKSPYVVKTHDIIQQIDYCYIVMEQCPNGTLKEYIQKKGTFCII